VKRTGKAVPLHKGDRVPTGRSAREIAAESESNARIIKAAGIKGE